MVLTRVVVGVDGSKGGAAALCWAAEEAAIHHTRATAVLAWTHLLQYHVDPDDDGFRHGYGATSAEAALDAYVRSALGSPDAVDRRVVCDLPTNALLDEAERADLLVVGARGAGGFEGLLLGSVASRVVERAVCPVAVVRGSAERDGRIVVGIDGSGQASRALRWAAEEALAREVPLEVVHAWRFPVLGTGGWMPSLPTHDEARARAEEVLRDTLLDPALAELEVTGHLAEGGAAGSLLEQAAGAGLVVVGSRGAGRLAGWILGSVSRQLVDHGPCPVVVV